MLLEGQQIDRYRIVRLLGSGGMGDVYFAEDAHIDQQVAIKVIRTDVNPYPHAEGTTEAMRLFQRELKAIVKLDHPYILPLFDYGEEHMGDVDLLYLVMPYRQEGSLAKWLSKRESTQALSVEEVTHFILQAAEALQHAHDHTIIHQDVKPSNFLIRENKRAYPDLLLTDFGIARLSTVTSNVSHAIRGTPSYMAPEQWENKPVFATDQYALAVMAYELLSNRPLFQGTPGFMMYQHINIQPPPPSTLNPYLPKDIDMVLLHALAKRHEQRFSSMNAFANAFRQATQGVAETSMPTNHSLRTSPNTPVISQALVPQPASSGDLRAVLAISTTEAQTGTTRTVTLPGGRRVPVAVPPHVSDGHIVRIDGQGDPSQEDGVAGALILTIIVKEETNTFLIPNSIAAGTTLLLPSSAHPQASGPVDTNASDAPPASDATTSDAPVILFSLTPSSSSPETVASTQRTIKNEEALAGTIVLPPTPSKPKRRAWFVGSLVLLVLLLVIGSAAYAASSLFTSSVTPSASNIPQKIAATVPMAVVTITPLATNFKQNYTIIEVAGAPDVTKNQIQGVRTITANASQSSQAKASGTGQTAATRATGTLTFYQPTQAVVIPAGAQFTGSRGIAVAITGTVTLNLGSTVSVGAYALQGGAVGNIPAYDFNASYSYKGIAFYIQNAAAFSNGQDSQSYPVVQQGDIDGAAQALTGPVTQAAQNNVGTQLLSSEQIAGNKQCASPQTSADHAAGDSASVVNVTVQVTCQASVYKPQLAQAKTSDLLKQDLPKKLGVGYSIAGAIQTTLTGTKQEGANVSLSIDAEAAVVFGLNDTQTQSLASQIAGKSQQDAQTLIAQQIGQSRSTITFSGGNEGTLPTDAKNIVIKVAKS